MIIKMTTNSQLSTTESKMKQSKQSEQEQTQIWRSFGGLSIGRGKGDNGGKGTQIMEHKLLGTK